jgi:hypothetical protein
VNITNNNVDKYISICNINIRSVRNKLHFLQNFADEYDILCVTESLLDVNINNDNLSLDFFSRTFIRKDCDNSGGGLLIYFKDDIFVERGVTDLENDIDETIWIKVRARGQTFRIGECPSNSPFLKDNGAEAPKGPRSIVFKEWRDTRTFSNFKSTHCTLLILLIINLVTKKSMCIVSKVQSIKLFAPCGTLKVQREQ